MQHRQSSSPQSHPSFTRIHRTNKPFCSFPKWSAAWPRSKRHWIGSSPFGRWRSGGMISAHTMWIHHLDAIMAAFQLENPYSRSRPETNRYMPAEQEGSAALERNLGIRPTPGLPGICGANENALRNMPHRRRSGTFSNAPVSVSQDTRRNQRRDRNRDYKNRLHAPPPFRFDKPAPSRIIAREENRGKRLAICLTAPQPLAPCYGSKQ